MSDDGLFIVGYQRAKHDINFKSHNANDPSFVDGENYIAKGTRIPTYWKLKPGSKPSCNSACKNGEEVHLEVLGSAKRIANGKTNPSIKAPISLNVEGAYQNVDIEALSKTEFADSYNAEMNDAQTKTEYMSKVNGIYSYGDQYYVFGMNSDGYAAFAVID
ncbi:hypothetical protein JCM19239_1416 [Vibrio variabilis]|uniref:Uncharacterized protein n=1 Tax=Vibrio variabilis TaxID=990271 RepID=A0ABQ0JPF8_9VIBR|nr:hypothetical protein JCM19239_1416 [Vibrio variabilis]